MNGRLRVCLLLAEGGGCLCRGLGGGAAIHRSKEGRSSLESLPDFLCNILQVDHILHTSWQVQP